MVRTEGGYAVVKEQADVSSKELEIKAKMGKARQTPEFSTASAAAAHVGFPVRLPAYLPAGYEQVSISGDGWENTGKGFYPC